MRTTFAFFAFVAAVAVAASARAGETVIPLDGTVPDDGSAFLRVPFTVPPGTAEIEVRHDDLSDANILDWGLDAPGGAFRGWGGGNVEPAVVAEKAASRSYLPGAISAGEWRVVIGKAKIAEKPARYHVEVHLRDAPTLAPQPERAPYAAAAPLSKTARWYAGDLHVHSRESGDARPTLDEIATFARSRGLDFVGLSDHNTVSQLDFIVDAQRRHPDLLLLPSVEFTTYAGHANGLGALKWVDHKLGIDGNTLESAAAAFAAQGAIFSINHPVLELGQACIGCAWKMDVPASVGAVEIATGGWRQSGNLFDERAIAFWDALCAQGRHLVAVGGSDDHSAGKGMGRTDSPIGDPTTMVFATELSAKGILDGIRAGRTVVRLQGPGDPMVELIAVSGTGGYDTWTVGETVTSVPHPTLRATVTGGKGQLLRFVKNNGDANYIAIDADPFVDVITVDAPASGEDRYRAEVWVDNAIRVVTNNVWVAAASDGPPIGTESCAIGGGVHGARFAFAALLLVAVARLSWRRRRTASRGTFRARR